VVAGALGAPRRRRRRFALATATGVSSTGTEEDYTLACPLSEVPKGTRKLVTIEGANLLLFWYRNELFAIENRSPAEGAFSQGFEQARLTQDYGILCPSTDTEFNLKTGAVVNWMPNNSVLRLLTPACPPLDVFAVKVVGDDVLVRLAAGTGARTGYFDGGAKSSFERNNVFGIEPRMYLDDGSYVDEKGATQRAAGTADPATILISTVAVAIVAVVGTASCLYFENIPALALFWIVGFGLTAKVVLDFTGGKE